MRTALPALLRLAALADSRACARKCDWVAVSRMDSTSNSGLRNSTLQSQGVARSLVGPRPYWSQNSVMRGMSAAQALNSGITVLLVRFGHLV